MRANSFEFDAQIEVDWNLISVWFPIGPDQFWMAQKQSNWHDLETKLKPIHLIAFKSSTNRIGKNESISMMFPSLVNRILLIISWRKLESKIYNPGESIELKLIPSELELFRAISEFVYEPFRVIPNQSEKRFVSHLMKNGQKSIRLNLINSETSIWMNPNQSKTKFFNPDRSRSILSRI